MADDYGNDPGGYQPGIGNIDIVKIAADSKREADLKEAAGIDTPEFSDDSIPSSSFSTISTNSEEVSDTNNITRDILKKYNPISKKKTRDKIESSRSLGILSEDESTDGGAIASPLTERDDARTFYSSYLLNSSDGFFTVELRHVQATLFDDANAQEVEVNYYDPNATN